MKRKTRNILITVIAVAAIATTGIVVGCILNVAKPVEGVPLTQVTTPEDNTAQEAIATTVTDNKDTFSLETTISQETLDAELAEAPQNESTQSPEEEKIIEDFYNDVIEGKIDPEAPVTTAETTTAAPDESEPSPNPSGYLLPDGTPLVDGMTLEIPDYYKKLEDQPVFPVTMTFHATDVYKWANTDLNYWTDLCPSLQQEGTQYFEHDQKLHVVAIVSVNSKDGSYDSPEELALVDVGGETTVCTLHVNRMSEAPPVVAPVITGYSTPSAPSTPAAPSKPLPEGAHYQANTGYIVLENGKYAYPDDNWAAKSIPGELRRFINEEGVPCVEVLADGYDAPKGTISEEPYARYDERIWADDYARYLQIARDFLDLNSGYSANGKFLGYDGKTYSLKDFSSIYDETGTTLVTDFYVGKEAMVVKDNQLYCISQLGSRDGDRLPNAYAVDYPDHQVTDCG